ncbi:MAG: nitroreductase [Pseudomonadota bacterium]
MDILEAFRERKTVRGYLKKQVPGELIKDILHDALWAPSASNQQPWNFHVITGNPLADLCAKIQEARISKPVSYDPSKGKTIPAEYVERTKILFKGIRPYISLLGDDNKSFIESGSFRFYDAPVVIFLTLHTSMPQSRLIDMGMAAQNLMLSAYARGLGTCAIALTLAYADVIQKALGITEEFSTVLSIALGYQDNDFVINKFRSSRDALEKFVTWKGFND